MQTESYFGGCSAYCEVKTNPDEEINPPCYPLINLSTLSIYLTA